MITNHVFSAFSFISFVIVSIPIVWHLQALNTATCLYMIWVAMSNLAYFINSIIWDGNVVDWAPVWCDITIRINLGIGLAVPATCLCIQRRVYHVMLNPNAVIATRAEKRRGIIEDMLIGLGLPILYIILEYIVQVRRYDILEDFGCRAPILSTSLGLVLIPVPQIVISLISCVYGCLNMRHLWVKWRTSNSLMISSAGGIGSSRYLRLFILSGIDIFFILPISILKLTTWFPLYRWLTWEEIHSDWSRIGAFPATVLRSVPRALVSNELNRWISVIYAIVFFALFGFAEEAKKHYRSTFQTVAKKVGYQTISSVSSQNRSSDQYGNVRPTKYSRSSDGKSRSTTAYSTEFDSESKYEVKAESSAPSPDSPLSTKSQPRTPPSTIPRDLESAKAVDTTPIEVV